MGSRIRAFRKLKGFTQEELASSLEVSLAVLGAIERGARKPEQRILQRIANTLQITLEELISES